MHFSLPARILCPAAVFCVRPEPKATQEGSGEGQIVTPPEAAGDILGDASGSGRFAMTDAVEALVGGGRLEAAAGRDVRAGLDVVEVAEGLACGERVAAGPPGAAQAHFLFDVGAEAVHGGRIGIAAHQADAGHFAGIIAVHLPEHRLVEHVADVLPQMRAVAAGAMNRTPGEVDGQRHLIGYLLEYDIVVVVLKHPGPRARRPARA